MIGITVLRCVMTQLNDVLLVSVSNKKQFTVKMQT